MSIKYFCLLLWALVSASTIANGFDKSVAAQNIRTISIEIDGVRNSHTLGSTVNVFPGQTIVVGNVSFLDQSMNQLVDAVNVVGLVNPLSPRSVDDRGIAFTVGDLHKKWAINEKYSKYRVDVRSERTILGSLYIEIIPPRIEYIRFLINGNERIYRDGDLIDVKSSDKFSIKHIKLNLPSSKRLQYKLIELKKGESGSMGKSDYRYFELVIYYMDKIVLTFPMRVWNET